MLDFNDDQAGLSNPNRTGSNQAPTMPDPDPGDSPDPTADGRSTLTQPQMLAIEALAAGKTTTEAAEMAGVHRTHVHRWRKDPEFEAALNRREREVLDRVQRQLLAGLESAATTVTGAIRDGDVKTARWLLERAQGLSVPTPTEEDTDPEYLRRRAREQEERRRGRQLLDALTGTAGDVIPALAALSDQRLQRELRSNPRATLRLLEQALVAQSDLADALGDLEKKKTETPVPSEKDRDGPSASPGKVTTDRNANTDLQPLLKEPGGPDFNVKPPTIDEFLDDPRYLAHIGARLSPVWREHLRRIFDPQQPAFEVVFTGPGGTGKTTAALVAQLFVLCRLLCLRDPQNYYELMPGSLIELGLFSTTLALAEEELCAPFRSYLEASPFFQQYLTACGGHQNGTIEFENSLHAR